MRSTNDNKAITKLPILLTTSEEAGGDGWISGPDLVQVLSGRGMVLKRYPVRVVPENALKQFVHPKTRAAFESTFGCVPEDASRQLLSLLGITGAADKNDLKQVAMLAERAGASIGKAAPSWAVASALLSPWDRVGAAVNTGLYGTGRITPVLWQKESQLVPALLCFDAANALFAHALFFISGKRGLGVCRRCGNPFFASRGQQSFCSYRCRVAEAMKRYRAGLKLRESQKRKRVARRNKRRTHSRSKAA